MQRKRRQTMQPSKTTGKKWSSRKQWASSSRKGCLWHTPLLATLCQGPEEHCNGILEHVYGTQGPLSRPQELLGAHLHNEVTVSWACGPLLTHMDAPGAIGRWGLLRPSMHVPIREHHPGLPLVTMKRNGNFECVFHIILKQEPKLGQTNHASAVF